MREYVYFIKSGGRIKIGRSQNVARRLRELASHLVEAPVILATFPGGKDLESALHQHLKEFWDKFEWFHDCGEVRSTIVLLAEHGDRVLLLNAARKPKSTPGTIIAQVARKVWPRHTAFRLSEAAGVTVRRADQILTGTTGTSGDVIVSLLHSEHGGEFLKAIMLAAPSAPSWWVRDKRFYRLAEIAIAVEELQNQRERLEQGDLS